MVQYHKLTSREVFVEVNESVRVRNVNGDRRAQSPPTIWNPGEGKKHHNLRKTQQAMIK